MKRNNMMRLAAVLLVAVLFTSSVISGTFAKYVTQGSVDSIARVAKFGVSITFDDNNLGAFRTGYDTDESENNASVQVAASSTGNVVAPGTNGSMTFKIEGMPEVATKLTVTATGDPIYLGAGTYTLENGKFDNEDVSAIIASGKTYEPIKWTLTKDGETNALVEKVSLSELNEKLKELSQAYAVNTQLDATYTIEWEWAFDNTVDTDVANWNSGATAPYSGATVGDFLDTVLGDLQAAEESDRTVIISDSNAYRLNTKLNLTIRIEQVDTVETTTTSTSSTES